MTEMRLKTPAVAICSPRQEVGLGDQKDLEALHAAEDPPILLVTS
mgnify:CR=1 FL=1